MEFTNYIRRLCAWGLTALASANPLFAYAGDADASPRQTYLTTAGFVEDQVIVRYKSDASSDAIRLLGLSPISQYDELEQISVIHTLEGKDVSQTIEVLQNSDSILYAEPNYIVRIQETHPNDTRYEQLWGLLDSKGAGLNMPSAWDLTTGSDNVVIGVIDTGTFYTHEDLAENIWHNPNEIADNGLDDDNNGWIDDIHGVDTINKDNDPLDDNDHGTHVAGVIAGVGNNGTGISGVNWRAKIASCKFLGADGSGPVSAALDCMNYFLKLKNLGINVVAVNNSWGGGGYSRAFDDAVNAHEQAGILFVAAAGNGNVDNDGPSGQYPSGYQQGNVISVASIDASGLRSTFSNYGTKSVDVSAPGSNILSTVKSGGYNWFSGTSMAAPYVSGLIGLVSSYRPELTIYQIKNLILSSGRKNDTVATLSGRNVRAYDVDGNGGVFNCVHAPLKARVQPTKDKIDATVGSKITIEVLNVNCENPSSTAVQASIKETGEVITLNDNGIFPDVTPSDGLFSAEWEVPGAGLFTVKIDGEEEFTVGRERLCQFGSVYLRGSFNRWSTYTMTCDTSIGEWVAQNITFGDESSEPRFKFDRLGDWKFNYGDNNRDGYADQSGENIPLPGKGTYNIHFNDWTFKYTISEPPKSTAPVADAGENATIRPGDTLQFNGSGSEDYDNNIVEYSWHSDSLAGFPLYGVSPSYTFENIGVYVIQLQVLDADGQMGVDEMAVTVAPNKAPVANAGADATTTINTPVQFNGSKSYDSDGSIVSYTWHSSAFTTPLTGSNPSFLFEDEGNYTVTLTVTDDEGATHSDEMKVAVHSVLCDFNYSSLYLRGSFNRWGALAMVQNQKTCLWEVTAIFTPDEDWRYKFDRYADWSVNYGDSDKNGYADRSGTNIPLSGPGQYQVTFNDANLRYTHTLIEEDLPPVADAGPDMKIKVGTPVSFDGSDSYGQNSEIISYRWQNPQFGSDLEGVSPTYTFKEVGQFVVNLIVTTDNGLSANDQLTVTVIDNFRPIAKPGEDVTVLVGQKVTLDGSQSEDPDGEIVNYAWTSGDIENALHGAIHELTFDTPGSYEFTLWVQDDDDAVSSASITITVIEKECDYRFSKAYLRGTFNSWGAKLMDKNKLTCDWETEVTFGSSSKERFKLDIYADWSRNYGDNGTDGSLERWGADIPIKQGEGRYRVSFNDRTMRYSVTKL